MNLTDENKLKKFTKKRKRSFKHLRKKHRMRKISRKNKGETTSEYMFRNRKLKSNSVLKAKEIKTRAVKYY